MSPADDYIRQLREDAAREDAEHARRLDAEMAQRRVLGTLGFNANAIENLMANRAGHAVGIDRGPLEQNWTSFVVCPPLEHETVAKIDADVERMLAEYVRIPDHPELPPLTEVTDVLSHPLHIDRRETADQPAHSILKLSRRLPQDALASIARILREHDVQFDAHALEIASLSTVDTLKGPYALALRPQGTLKVWVIHNGKRWQAVELCVNSRDLGDDDIFVQRGLEGHEHEWTPAAVTETDAATTDAPVWHTGRMASHAPDETWVEFELFETSGIRPATDGGASLYMPRRLHWHVRVAGVSDNERRETAKRVVQGYGAYFSILAEPVHPFPQQPLPSSPPEPPKKLAQAAALPYPNRPSPSARNPTHVSDPTPPPPPPHSGTQTMRLRERESEQEQSRRTEQ